MRALAVPLGFVAALLALSLASPNPYVVDLLVKSLTNAGVCIGLGLLLGLVGQVSLGHAAFFAIGGYATAILCAKHGWSPPLALLAGAALTALIAYPVSRVVLRLHGHYLAMATLGVGLIISIVLNREIALTGGPDGMSVPGFGAFNWRASSPLHLLWLAGLYAALCSWLALNLLHSRAGRALRAIRSSEIAAATAGIDVAAYKTKVFVLSAVMASVAGSIFAHADRFISPAEAGFLRSIEFITMIVFGGASSVLGCVLGAFTLTVLPVVLAGLHEWRHVFVGALLMAVVVFMPQGIVPAAASALRAWRRKAAR